LGGSETRTDWLGPKISGRPALVLHSSNEQGELSQFQSTINIVMADTIIIIITL